VLFAVRGIRAAKDRIMMRKSIRQQFPRLQRRTWVALMGVVGASAITLQAGALGTVFGTANQHLLTRGAAETSITPLGPNGLLTTGMNADDPSPNKIIYSDGTRTVNRGASNTAFSTYNWNNRVVASQGQMRAPTGWAVLWGDTSVARSKTNTSMVYLASLAIPNAKFPPPPNGFPDGKIVGGMESKSAPCPGSDGFGAYLGGACISRSNNDGQTWSTAAPDCLQNTSNCSKGDFYDGSDMTTSPEGRVYAAFNNINRGGIDVWMATSATGTFGRLPYDGGLANLHPRLKYGPDGLYLLYESFSSLTLARYNGGSSFTGSWTSITVPGSSGINEGTNPKIQLSDRAIRLGPEYDFDIGINDTGANEIRIAFVLRTTGGKHYIKAVKCTTGTISCSAPAAWSTAGTNGDQWGPAIAYGFNFMTGKPTWEISYYSRQRAITGNTVELWVADISSGSNITTVNLEGAQVACPDLRGNDSVHDAGYWGDYDRMGATIGMLWRGFTDSSHGTCSRQQFHSTPVYAALSMWAPII
jgi:hypothetical protein